MQPVANTCEPAATAGKTPAGILPASVLNRFGPADWLSLAAAPTFVAMAGLTAFAGKTEMICAADQGVLPLTGMAMMYLLMSAFHLAPWLRLLGRRGAPDGKATVPRND